jgi:electron transfer flavoprotein alpha subunit
VLVIAEATDGALAPVSAELLGAAGRLASELNVEVGAILVGSKVSALASELGQLGASTVYVADDPSLAAYEGESYSRIVERAAQQAKPEIVLVGQTLTGRDLATRLAFRLDTAVTTDCTALRLENGQLIMTKPVYGGNALAEYACPETRPQIATLRARAFEPASADPAGQANVVSVALSDVNSRVKVLDLVKEEAATGPRLKDAKIVVSGGRGLGGPENWHVVEEVASTLGAAVGATRAVTDAGWVPPTLQVGLTGITITPDLYITVAVSGAVQHIAGCSGARNIIAINKDSEANIFKHSRYGVVGDWKEVLPAFTTKLKELVSQ